MDKEKLYWVRNRQGKSLLYKIKGHIMEGGNYDGSYQREHRHSFTFTEKEIKDYDERYWAFAVPVGGGQ